MDHVRRLARCGRHFQRIKYQCGLHAAASRPANAVPTRNIEHDRQIQEAARRLACWTRWLLLLAQLRLAHQARDRCLADALANVAEIVEQPWSPIGLLRARVEGAEVRKQRRAAHAPTLRVIPAHGDSKHAAHRGDGKDGLVRFHESEDRSTFGMTPVSRAHQATAYPKMSRSS